MTSAAMDHFMSYHWPGNVRALKSALEYAFVIAEDGLIDLGQLPPQIAQRMKTAPSVSSSLDKGDRDERTAHLEALKQSRGNQSKAARSFGVNRMTVWNRMKKYKIDLKREIVS